MESMILEILLQLSLQVFAELSATVFILAIWMWQFAIWGAPILSQESESTLSSCEVRESAI